MTEKYNTKCMSGLIMIFWIPLEISRSKLKAFYTLDYMDTFLCIIMEVNIYVNISFLSRWYNHESEYVILF